MTRKAIARDVHVSREYPHSPEAVWRALTDRALLAAWLMENDFEPTLGHRFTMRTEPGPGFDGIVHAEVLELEAPWRMSWRWRGGPVDTTLRFRLEACSAGTRLSLAHEGFSGLPAVLVSFILGAGWARMLRRRLPALIAALADGQSAAAAREACASSHEHNALWYWLARSFAPLLRRARR
jgi:uncharacterized protein YndB with AHSA1/START domain